MNLQFGILKVFRIILANPCAFAAYFLKYAILFYTILALGKSSGSIFPLYSFLVSIYKIVLGIHGSLVHDGI